MKPELNLRSPDLLLGLCFRCLAGDADPAEAPVTRRRLEDLKAEATELSLELSGVRADLGIARDRAAAAARELEDAQVDLKLFGEKHPQPPERRGLLGRRQGREDPAVRERRKELGRLLELARDAAKQTAERVEQLAGREEQLLGKLGECRDAQRELAAGLRGQHVAAALNACAAGDWPGADSRVGDLRQALRADISIAVLNVLTGLFRHGAAGGRQAVLESSGLFENHPPQARRVVEALLAYVEGARMGRNELGLVLPGQLEWDGLYRLYQSIAALSGWRVGPDESGDLASATTAALAACWSKEPPDAADPGDPRTRMVETAAAGDIVIRVLCAHCALKAGWSDVALKCTGVDAGYESAGGKREGPPGLMAQVAALPYPAWPEPLRPQWRTLLCCQALLAAAEHAGRELFEHWLSESYDWPKSDFYWWTLAQVKQDDGLLRNLTHDPADIVTMARI